MTKWIPFYGLHSYIFFLGGACKKVTSLINLEYLFLDSILFINTVRKKKELLYFLFPDHTHTHILFYANFSILIEPYSLYYFIYFNI